MTGTPPRALREPLARLPAAAAGFGLPGLLWELIVLAWRRAWPAPAAAPVAGLEGVCVVAAPGLFMTDWSTRHVRAYLTRCGCNCLTSGIGLNLGPTHAGLSSIDDAIESARKRGCDDIVLIGHSVGGTMMRLLAERRPRGLLGMVTTCSPARVPVETPLAPMLWILKWFYKHDEFVQISAGGLSTVPVLNLVASFDGVVTGQSLLPLEGEASPAIVAGATHMTICSTPEAHTKIAGAIAQWRKAKANVAGTKAS